MPSLFRGASHHVCHIITHVACHIITHAACHIITHVACHIIAHAACHIITHMWGGQVAFHRDTCVMIWHMCTGRRCGGAGRGKRARGGGSDVFRSWRGFESETQGKFTDVAHCTALRWSRIRRRRLLGYQEQVKEEMHTWKIAKWQRRRSTSVYWQCVNNVLLMCC